MQVEQEGHGDPVASGQCKDKGSKAMSAYARMKHEVRGHPVLISSWYDDRKQHWRASAPIYVYLDFLTAPATCHSRQAAVEQICHLLATYFDGQRDRQ